MSTLNARVDAAIKAAGVAIAGVAMGSPGNKATWLVQPASLQAAAQPIIDAFNPTDPALADADADAEVEALLGTTSGLLLEVLLDQFVAMQADVTAGTFQPALWKQRLRSRLKVVRRTHS